MIYDQMQDELLKNGVTGFWSSADPPPPNVPKSAILSATYAATRKAKWDVFEKTWSVHENFHQIEVSNALRKMTLLFNISFPLVAFCKSKTASFQNGTRGVPQFTDADDLAEAFRSLDLFRPLTVDELEVAVTPEHLTNLNEAELEQVRYWNPATVGELLFNYWD